MTVSAIRRNQLERNFKNQNGICWLCGVAMHLRTGEFYSATLDHVNPESQTAPNMPGRHSTNTKAAHFICNNIRGDKEGKQFVSAQDKMNYLLRFKNPQFRKGDIPLIVMGRIHAAVR